MPHEIASAEEFPFVPSYPLLGEDAERYESEGRDEVCWECNIEDSWVGLCHAHAK
jgi:histone deacetylase complex regulatory component SIN3